MFVTMFKPSGLHQITQQAWESAMAVAGNAGVAAHSTWSTGVLWHAVSGTHRNINDSIDVSALCCCWIDLTGLVLFPGHVSTHHSGVQHFIHQHHKVGCSHKQAPQSGTQVSLCSAQCGQPYGAWHLRGWQHAPIACSFQQQQTVLASHDTAILFPASAGLFCSN